MRHMKTENKIIAFQIDPLDSINVKTDTSFLLALEMQKRGYKLFFYQVKDLFVENHVICAIGFFALLKNEEKQRFYVKEDDITINLADVALVMIRQDPPFNMQYITATYILERLPKTTLILNDPQAIRSLPEKLSPLIFDGYLPEFIITENIHTVRKFAELHQTVVVKPLYQHGGQDVIKLKFNDAQFETCIMRYISMFGFIMVQKFIDTVEDQGDKRIIMVDGEILGYFNRKPAKGDFRSNMAVGGSCFPCELSAEEQTICKKIGDILKVYNIFFAGIDLLSEKIIEINVTSPTGIAFLNNMHNKKYEEKIVDLIEMKMHNE